MSAVPNTDTPNLTRYRYPPNVVFFESKDLGFRMDVSNATTEAFRNSAHDGTRAQILVSGETVRLCI